MEETLVQEIITANMEIMKAHTKIEEAMEKLADSMDELVETMKELTDGQNEIMMAIAKSTKSVMSVSPALSNAFKSQGLIIKDSDKVVFSKKKKKSPLKSER
jgi:hypothetical protein